MTQYIDKSALVVEIEKSYNECLKRAKITDSDYWNAKADAYRNVLTILNDTLEVKEVDNTPNIRFPHYKSIVEKVFGAGNLESFEYNEAEQLVLLAKEELLKDLEVKDVDLEEELNDFIEHQNAFVKDDRVVEYDNGDSFNHIYDLEEIAKHFFELGLKTQKGE